MCDSTGQVHEFIIRSHPMRINDLNVLEALNIAEQYQVIKEKNIINQIMEKLELLSAIYHFALILLNLKQKSKMDIVRTGMFHNAYFHIINLNKSLPRIKGLYLNVEMENARKQ